MTIIVESKEMYTILTIMIINDHYTVKGLRELVDSYNDPRLSSALDCVMEEGTINTIIQFFLDNPDIYSHTS